MGKEAVGVVVQWACEHDSPSGFIYPVAMNNGHSRLIAAVLSGIVTETPTAAKYDLVLYSKYSYAISKIG